MIKANHEKCIIELHEMEALVKASTLLIRHFRHVSVHFSILWEYVHGWLSFRRGSPERALKIWGNGIQHTKLKGNSLIIYRIKRLIIFLNTHEKQSLSLSASQILLECYKKELQEVPMNEIVDQKREASGARSNVSTS